MYVYWICWDKSRLRIDRENVHITRDLRLAEPDSEGTPPSLIETSMESLVPIPIEDTTIDKTSVRNGLGALAAPRGNCQEDWTGPDDNFHSVPSWDILGLQV